MNVLTNFDTEKLFTSKITVRAVVHVFLFLTSIHGSGVMGNGCEEVRT
jgi:hypothetical protein